MQNLSNKIEAHDRSIYDVLNDQKYIVDYFQREYKWEERHVEQLISDLAAAFIQENKPEHSRKDVAKYNSYYLGPFVVSMKDGYRSIIDGQQRLTTLTLFLIYLNNIQKELGYSEKIEQLIFSEKYGEMSFNIQVEERISCMESLFKKGTYYLPEDADESTTNLLRRYEDIDKAFPEELKDDSLPFFLDWLKHNVILVEIIAYSDENAYTIFETMNDRGLNLTPTEMLKSYILSRFKSPKDRENANKNWKLAIQKLHDYEKDEDQRFVQAWFRAQYADTIRVAKIGSKNEDFEKISTRFHSWFRDNLPKMNLDPNTPEGFERFIENDFKFFLNAYLKILETEKKFDPSASFIYYINKWGIADSLSRSLMLAPLATTDSNEVCIQKMDWVARFIESFVVRRSINFRKFSANSISYTMYTLVKEIRNKPLPELKQILKRKLEEMNETWDDKYTFAMHQTNYRFVRFLLSRITSFIEEQSGINSSFEKYYINPIGRPYEIEHVWADKFSEHANEFTQTEAFDRARNQLGALLLLPRGTNQSYGGKPYKEKLSHYIKENLLAQSLCDLAYQNNPNFKNMANRLNLPFRPHAEFNLQDINERQSLYFAICKHIWGIENFE